MDVFNLRAKLVSDYSTYFQSFVTIRDERIHALVGQKLCEGFPWPEALVQLNPRFAPGEPLSDLIAEKLLHPECLKIFDKKNEDGSGAVPIRLHSHQVEGIRAARAGRRCTGQRRGSPPSSSRHTERLQLISRKVRSEATERLPSDGQMATGCSSAALHVQRGGRPCP